MSSQQKFVKYLATALAIFLATAIIAGIVGGVLFLTVSNTNVQSTSDTLPGMVPKGNVNNSGHHTGETHSSKHSALTEDDFSSRSYTFQEIETIEVDSSIYSLHLMQGAGKNIEVNLTNVYNGYIVEQKGSTLSLKEPDTGYNFGLNHFFDFLDHVDYTEKSRIEIVLPAGFTAEKIELNGGVGNIELEKVTAKYLDIDAGTGNIKGFQVTADSVDIDGGTGNIEFTGSTFGDTKIDCGVGNTELSLSNKRSDYRISLDKGLGSIRLDGENLKFDNDYTENHDAPYLLDISSGVGNITIDFASSL